MRRTVQAFIIGCVTLSAAACGIATGSTPSAPVGAGPASMSSAEAATKSSCEALGQVYSNNMAPFAEALSKMVAGRGNRESQRQVQQSLKSFATAVRDATQNSADPQLRTDGKKTADQMQAKAADAGFITAIKTTEDVNTVIGPTLKEWLAPVARHCS